MTASISFSTQELTAVSTSLFNNFTFNGPDWTHTLNAWLRQLPPGQRSQIQSVYEIGVFEGRSMVAFDHHLTKLNEYWGIDARKGHEMYSSRETLKAYLTNFFDISVQNKSHCQTSGILSRPRTMTTPHLVFIDGDHSHEGCYQDIQFVTQCLGHPRYLLIDDYQLATVQTAIDRAIFDGILSIHERKGVVYQVIPHGTQLLVIQ